MKFISLIKTLFWVVLIMFSVNHTLVAQNEIDKNEALEFVKKCLKTFDFAGEKYTGYASYPSVSFNNHSNELILSRTYNRKQFTLHIVLNKVDISSLYISNVDSEYYLNFIAENGIYRTENGKITKRMSQLQISGYCLGQETLPKKFLRAFKDLCIACGASTKKSKYDSE